MNLDLDSVTRRLNMKIYNFERAIEGPENRFATDEEFRKASIIGKEDSPVLVLY